METIEITQKKEMVKTKMLNYLMKTSKHLFITENKRFYKVLVTKVDNDKWVIVSIKFNGEDFYLNIKELEVNDVDNDLALMKYGLFPQSSKMKSIKKIRLLTEKFYEIIKEVRKNYNGTRINNDMIKNNIKNMLKDISYIEKVN